MIRKILALVATTGLSLVLLPQIADAAVTGSATLTQGANVFPGTARLFSVEVTNTNSTGTLGLNAATSVDTVQVILPGSAGFTTAPGVAAPTGWKVRSQSAGNLQTYTFSDADADASNGGRIAPAAKLTFNFPANVAAPADGDVAAPIKVAVSDNNGASLTQVGNLISTIRTLEVVSAGVPTSPAGVLDGTGTGGQTIKYRTQVKNYAVNPVLVKPTLTSNAGSDVITPPADASVLGGAVGSFVFDVKLGGTTDRTSTFTAGGTTDKATAQTAQSTFGVQSPAVISLDSNTFDPKFVRTVLSYNFSIKGNKTGTVALKSLTGSLKLGAITTALNSPATIDGGSKPNTPFTYNSVVFPATTPDGKVTAEFAFTGTDINDFAFSYTPSFTDLLTIDNVAPILNLTSSLPSGQRAVKRADTVTVSGNVNDDSAIDFVKLVEVTTSGTAQEIPVTVTRTGNNFSGSVVANFTSVDGTFKTVAQATDKAGNPGGITITKCTTTVAGTTNTAADCVIDNLAPKFTDARTVASNKIEVFFTENRYVVAGGCDPSQWKVDQISANDSPVVLSVAYSDGTPCQKGMPGPDNYRILTISDPLDQRPRDADYITNVTYTPGNPALADPAKDSAAQNAPSDVVKTVIGIAPNAASLVKIQRNGGSEDAVLDGSYFTRFCGDDAIARFTGGRASYKVEVLDGTGAVISTKNLTDSSETGVTVPVPCTDGTHPRALRLVNTTGIRSPVTSFSITLDRVRPTLSGSALDTVDNKKITVTFSEKIAAGVDAAIDWYAVTAAANGSDDFIGIGSVSGSGATRTLMAQESIDGSKFRRAAYLFDSSPGKRYEDRAGNTFLDTISF